MQLEKILEQRKQKKVLKLVIVLTTILLMVVTLLYLFAVNNATNYIPTSENINVPTTIVVCPPNSDYNENECDSVISTPEDLQKLIIETRNYTQILLKEGKYEGIDLDIGIGENPPKYDIIISGESTQTIIDGLNEKEIIHIGQDSHIELTNLTLTNGTAYAVALQDDASIKISKVQFIDNYSSIGAFGQSNLEVKTSKFDTTQTGNHISVAENSNAIIRNNVLMRANQHGIKVFQDAKAKIQNNTVIQNQFDGINCADKKIPECNVTNNIISGNSRFGYRFESSAQIDNLTYNMFFENVSANWADTNLEQIEIDESNYITDPLFVSNSEQLGLNSPAINAGDPAISDFDGTRSDIGHTGGEFGCEFTQANCETPTNDLLINTSGELSLNTDCETLDINCDKQINIEDFEEMKRSLTVNCILEADLDQNGTCTNNDLSEFIKDYKRLIK